MALGGGTFTLQNKILPGSYINFVSISGASTSFSERGVATLPLELDWGIENEVFEVSQDDFYKNSLKLFGYDYAHEKLRNLRELFLNAKTLYAYRLNTGVKASNEFCTALYSGVRGNDLGVVISKNADDTSYYDVSLYLESMTVLETQTVKSMSDLTNSDFVVWNTDTTIVATAHTPLTGGLNNLESTATNSLATAVVSGANGNNINISIVKKETVVPVDSPVSFTLDDNLGDQGNQEPETTTVISYVFNTYNGETQVNTQEVSSVLELANNAYVLWANNLTDDFIEGLLVNGESGRIYLTGGSSGSVTSDSHQNYLNLIESYGFNTIGVATSNNLIKNMYASFTKRMRDDMGVKFQLVVHDLKADHEGVISVKNTCVGDETALIYWVCGCMCGCEVNKSALNKVYDGEYNINVSYTQTELINFMNSGYFTLHRVNSDVRVLSDINSLTSFTDEKSDIFKENQTIRVVDQIATDIAVTFNTKYLGIIPNDEAGRISLWTDIVKHHETLQTIRAIENFSDKDVSVMQGESKTSVVVSDAITVTNTMAKLYMTVEVA